MRWLEPIPELSTTEEKSQRRQFSTSPLATSSQENVDSDGYVHIGLTAMRQLAHFFETSGQDSNWNYQFLNNGLKKHIQNKKGGISK